MQQTSQALRRLLMAAVLASAFALPAFADEIECGVAPPAPPSAPTEATEAADGDFSEVIASLLSGLLAVL